MYSILCGSREEVEGTRERMDRIIKVPIAYIYVFV
jgi:hypothetical protein